MTVPDPKTPREWALLCVAQWGRSEEFPGHPFPGLVDYIELTIKTALANQSPAGAVGASWDEVKRVSDLLDALAEARAALTLERARVEALLEFADRVRAAYHVLNDSLGGHGVPVSTPMLALERALAARAESAEKERDRLAELCDETAASGNRAIDRLHKQLDAANRRVAELVVERDAAREAADIAMRPRLIDALDNPDEHSRKCAAWGDLERVIRTHGGHTLGHPPATVCLVCDALASLDRLRRGAG